MADPRDLVVTLNVDASPLLEAVRRGIGAARESREALHVWADEPLRELVRDAIITRDVSVAPFDSPRSMLEHNLAALERGLWSCDRHDLTCAKRACRRRVRAILRRSIATFRWSAS